MFYFNLNAIQHGIRSVLQNMVLKIKTYFRFNYWQTMSYVI